VLSVLHQDITSSGAAQTSRESHDPSTDETVNCRCLRIRALPPSPAARAFVLVVKGALSGALKSPRLERPTKTAQLGLPERCEAFEKREREREREKGYRVFRCHFPANFRKRAISMIEMLRPRSARKCQTSREQSIGASLKSRVAISTIDPCKLGLLFLAEAETPFEDASKRR